MPERSIISVNTSGTMTPDDAAYWNRETIRIRAGLHHLTGNARPHFSLTGEIGPRHDPFACGCLHDEIVGARPDLAPIERLHLSDYTGAPMHAESNGWYWLAGALGGMGCQYHGGNGKRQHWKPGRVFDGYRESTPAECLQTFADHCRVSLEEAQRIADAVKGAAEPRAAWRAECDAMRPRWADEARAGIALLEWLAGRPAEWPADLAPAV